MKPQTRVSSHSLGLFRWDLGPCTAVEHPQLGPTVEHEHNHHAVHDKQRTRDGATTGQACVFAVHDGRAQSDVDASDSSAKPIVSIGLVCRFLFSRNGFGQRGPMKALSMGL